MPNSQILIVSLLAVAFVICIYAIGACVLSKTAKKKNVFCCLLVNGCTTVVAAVLLLSPFFAPRGLQMLDYYIPFVIGAGVCWCIGEVFLFLAVAFSLKSKQQKFSPKPKHSTDKN